MELGDKIKKLRLERGMTQEELAAKLKTTKQTIGKYETGIVTNLPLNRIKELADALDASPAYLIGWEAKGVDDRVSDLAALTEDFTQEELESLASYAEFLKSKRE